MEILEWFIFYIMIVSFFNAWNDTKIPETFLETLKAFCLPYVIIKRKEVRTKL